MHSTRRDGVWRHSPFLALGTLCATLGCSGPGPNPGTTTPSWLVDPVPVLSLGDSDSGVPVIFSRVNGVGLLDDGGIVVGEGDGSIRVFGPSGTLLAEAGGEGQGPGEFSYLSSVHTLRGDTILAYDPVAYRLTAFDRLGGVAFTTRLEPAGAAPELYVGRDTEGRHVLSVIHPAPSDPSRVSADRMEIRRYSSDGGAWESLGFYSGMRRVRSPVPFSPHPLGAVIGSTVVSTDGLKPILTVTVDDETRSVPIKVGVAPVSRAEAWVRLEEALQDEATRERLAATLDGPAWDSIPHYSDLLTDPEGRLWLKHYAPSSDSHWVLRQREGGSWAVVSTDGQLIASVSVPDHFRVMTIGRDRIAGVGRDALGVEHVRVYRFSPAREPAA